MMVGLVASTTTPESSPFAERSTKKAVTSAERTKALTNRNI